MDDSIDSTMAATLESIQSGGGDAGSDAGGGSAATGAGDQRTAPAGYTDQSQVQQPEPWRAPPKSWKKEYGDAYSRLDPNVMQYIHQREDEALRGIRQYAQQAESWNKVLAPYQQMIQQYGVNPQQVVGNLAAVHTILRFGTPEQRMQVVQMLEKDYGLSQYFNQGKLQQPTGADLTPVSNRISAIETQLQNRALADATTSVESFISDPKNKYAAEAAPKMLELLEQGRASTLPEAYEIATRTDPTIFRRIIDDEVATLTRGGARAPTNVRPRGTPANSAGTQRGTIEDTMRATLNEINSR